MRAILLLIWLFSGAAWAQLTADEIVSRADAGKMPNESIGFVATVKDFKNQDMIKETHYQILVKNHDASLVLTTYPERQVGHKFLLEGDNMWIYTPDIKKPSRISMQQKLTGEIATGDVARTDFAGDYKASLIDTQTVNGKEAYHLNLTARRSGVTYVKIEYWVGKRDFVPIKAVFYAVSGKPLKTGLYGGIKTVLGHRCVTQLLVQDAVDKSRKSILLYSQHKKMQIPDRMLAKESLNE